MNFKQKITYDSGKSTTYLGIIYIKKPYYIKWEYRYPIKRNIYISKNNIMLDEPELEQVTRIKMKKRLELFKIFRNTKKINKYKYIAKIENRKYTIFYKRYNIQKILFKDSLENDVSIVFSKHKKNISYKKNFFTFKIPSYYDILE
jgi:outer membrane lipoprotein carrier protein